MSSNHASGESYTTPTSILSKGGTGKSQTKNWGSKTVDVVRFSQSVNESQGAGGFLHQIHKIHLPLA